jgi:hypothetical protein
LSLIALSCTKQESPKISPDIEITKTELERLSSCSTVGYNKGLLKHKSILALFKCSKWNHFFPALNEAIEKTDEKKWNHFWTPLGESFFDDKERRDRIISYVKKLDKEGGLDDLSELFTSLTTNNFFDILKKQFHCAEKEETCSSKVLLKTDLYNVLKLLEISEDDLLSLRDIIKNIAGFAIENEQKIKGLFSNIHKEKDFQKARLEFVDSIFESYALGVSDWGKRFLPRILETTLSDSKTPFLYDFFSKKSISELEGLSHSFLLDHQDKFKQYRLFANLNQNNYSCDGPSEFELKISEITNDFFKTLKFGDYESMLSHFSIDLANVKIAETFCPPLKRVTLGPKSEKWIKGYQMSLVTFVEDSIFTFSKKNNYALLKFFAHVAMMDKEFNAEKVVGHFGSKSYYNFSKFYSVVHKFSPELIELGYHFLQKLDSSTYFKLGHLVESTFDRTEEETFKSLGRIWGRLSVKEKTFLLSYMDKFFDHSINYSALFKFLDSILTEISTVIESVGSKLFGGNLEKTYQSIRSHVFNFSGDRVLSNFKEFYSREHILKVLEVIVRGFLIKKVEYDRVMFSVPLKRDEVPFRFEERHFTSRENKFRECVLSLSKRNYYEIVRTPTSSCSDFRKEKFGFSFLSWFSIAEFKFAKFINKKGLKDKKLISNTGLFSPEMLSQSVAILKKIDEEVSMASFLDGVGKFKKDYAYSRLEKAISSLYSIFNQPNKNALLIRNELLKNIVSEENKKIFMNYSLDFVELVHNYSFWKKERVEYAEDSSYSCKNYNNQKIGGIVCPSEKLLSFTINKIIKDLNSNYSDNKTALYELIQALSISGKFFIQKEKGTKSRYRIKVSDMASFLFDLSDKEKEINRLKIPFQAHKKSDYYYLNRNEPDYTKEYNLESNKEYNTKVNFSEKRVEMTTLDRLSVVLREVRFDQNYLGAHFKNAIAGESGYEGVVLNKGRLFKRCSAIKFCGKFMNKDQRRMGKNAVASYSSLYDLNTKENWKYGDLVKGILTAFVNSSVEESRKYNIVDIKVLGTKVKIPIVQSKKDLLRHNGKVLTKFAMLGGFSNMSRLLRKRFKTKNELNSFLSSTKFKIFEKNILRDLESKGFVGKVSKLLDKVVSVKNEEGKNLFEKFITFSNSLSYTESREVENILANALYIVSYIGNPNGVDFKEHFPEKVDYLLDLLNDYFELWPYLENSLSKEDVRSLLEATNSVLQFFSDGLVGDNKNLFHRFINNTMRVIHGYMEISISPKETIQKYMKKQIKEEGYGETYVELIKNFTGFIEYFSKNRDTARVFRKKYENILTSQNFNLVILRNYLRKTTMKTLCDENKKCIKNKLYDDFYLLVEFLLYDDPTNLNRLIDLISIEDKEKLSRMLERVLPTILLH